MDLADIVDTNEVLNELSLENDRFNLFDFYDELKDESRVMGACGFITRNQSFYCLAPSYHSYVFENVCGSIFTGVDPNVNEYYSVFNSNSSGDKYSHDWLYANMYFGVVSIQILSKNDTIIWIPEKINSFQKEKIIDFCVEMKRINDYLYKNGYKKINLIFNITKVDSSYISMNEEELIRNINSIVDDNCRIFYENIVSSYNNKKNKI